MQEKGAEMAETQREIYAIGQRITGLTAGEEYTFVLKKPPPRVDVENARRSVQAAESSMESASRAAAQLERAHYFALAGDVDSAAGAVREAEHIFRVFMRGFSDATDHAERASADAKSAPAVVRDAYETARDGANLGPKFIETVREPFEEALRAVSALVEQARVTP